MNHNMMHQTMAMMVDAPQQYDEYDNGPSGFGGYDGRQGPDNRWDGPFDQPPRPDFGRDGGRDSYDDHFGRWNGGGYGRTYRGLGGDKNGPPPQDNKQDNK